MRRGTDNESWKRKQDGLANKKKKTKCVSMKIHDSTKRCDSLLNSGENATTTKNKAPGYK